MKIAPRGDRVLARRVAGADRIGSVVIPEGARERTQLADLVAVGPAEALADLEPDMCVVIANYAGTTVTIDGEELLVLRDSEIIGVVTRGSFGDG